MFFTPHLLHDDRGFPEAWSGSWDFLNSRSSFVSGQQVGECGSLPPLVLLWHGVDLRVLSGVTGHSGSLPSCQKVCEHGALSVWCRLLGHCCRPRFFFIPQHSLKKSEIQFIYDYCLQNIKKIINSVLCEDIYLIQANHVAETSVLSWNQFLWHEAFLPGVSLGLDLPLRLREVSHEPQDDPPHCQRGLGITQYEYYMK